MRSAPLAPLASLLPDPPLKRCWQEALALQNLFLKERGLQCFLSALTPFSEFPPPFNRPFQPEPGFRYSWLLNGASAGQAAAVLAGPVRQLEIYRQKMSGLCDRIDLRLDYLGSHGTEPGVLNLARELSTGLRVGALRAGQRRATLRALLAKRGEGQEAAAGRPSWQLHLEEAARLRQTALALVKSQEGRYRFPAAQLSGRRPSLTAYQFGYLYPAGTLFFWEREEEQVRHGRFDPLFMNLWDYRRALGLESLFHH